MRNKPWERDELILALETYFSLDSRTPSPTLSEAIGLSRLLRKIPPLTGESRNANYRSVDSVVMKLMNFRSLDQTYHGVGLRASGKADKEVWEEFAEDPERLRQTVLAIRETIEHSGRISMDVGPYMQEAPEGSLLTQVHLTRERNGELIKRKKASVLTTQGRLVCEVCSFEFKEVYGPRGNGFIECHHTKPVHTLKPGDITRISELALVCANCHRMIHAQRPWLTIDELKDVVQERYEE